MTGRHSRRVLIVGNAEVTHVGRHFAVACESLGIAHRLCDTAPAFEASAWRRRFDWWVRGRRPTRLRAFSQAVVAAAREFAPDVLLTTGIAPVDDVALKAIGRAGVTRVNFLTDDPWNPAHRAKWFLRALPNYDRVFSPRRANMMDIAALVTATEYLPFAYAPDIHFVEEATSDAERQEYDADVMFAGGADEDRVRMLAPLVQAGLGVALYGGYWNRYGGTRASARGHLDPAGLRRATVMGRVAVCLVRRANRDGHAMRSYEAPAMRGCLMVERTDDHMALFGQEGEAVLYFDGPDELVRKTQWLLALPDVRADMAARGNSLVTSARHRYQDRLESLLGAIS